MLHRSVPITFALAVFPKLYHNSSSTPPNKTTMPHTSSPATTSITSTSIMGPVFTFRWICPNASCHTCPARTMKYQPSWEGLHAEYFDDYGDMKQLALEVEMEELSPKVLTHCNAQCKARQVHKSRDAQAYWAPSNGTEWSYVSNAKCSECGRVAGRTACLVEIQREGD